MAKKIKIIGEALERIEDTSRSLPRIEAAEFAAALGAEPCGERISGSLDLIALGELGNELIKRLRSTGGRPSLEGTTERCKVPLSSEDVAALEQVSDAIEVQTGARPALGQVASVILRMHLDALKTASSPAASVLQTHFEQPLSWSVLQAMIDQQIKPVRDRLQHLESQLQTASQKNR